MNLGLLGWRLRRVCTAVALCAVAGLCSPQRVAAQAGVGAGQPLPNAGSGNAGSGNAQPQQPGEDADPFTPRWAKPPQQIPFNGFPLSFPKGLGAFGSYPVQSSGIGLPGFGGVQATGPGGLPLFALPSDEAPGWPRWLRAIDAPEFPYVPGQALLLRQSERVWWKEPGEDAFVPLYFHDKVRSVVPGTEVLVRQTGNFELLLHGGGRVLSQGPTQLRVESMDDKQVGLKFSTLSKLRMQLSGREHQVQLPDGSMLIVPADVPPAAPEELPIGPAVLVLERADEPGQFYGRAVLWNGGQRAVRWRYALGEVELEPGHRLQFFLHPVAAATGAGLTVAAAEVVARGPVRTFTGNAGGAVQCCGASFALPKGARLSLDPLQGQPFEVPTPRR